MIKISTLTRRWIVLSVAKAKVLISCASCFHICRNLVFSNGAAHLTFNNLHRKFTELIYFIFKNKNFTV